MSRRPEGERAEVLEKLRGYLRSPKSMRQLTQWLDVNRRTVFRYFDDLQAAGDDVERVGIGRPTRYQLVVPY